MTHMLSVQYIQKALLSTLEDEKCSDLHPGSCNAKAIQQFANGCKGVYKMYLLVHLIPIIIFKRKKVVKDPVTELKKLVFGLIKSLLFAGGYSMLVRRIICLFTQHVSYNYISAYIAGVLAGVSLIFEPMGRQSEIALYTLNKSMEVIYNMGLRRKLPVRLPMGQCILNGVAMAILAFVYLAQPETFRDSYRKVLDQLMKDI